MANQPKPRYDELGTGYANVRRADPRIAARIDAALGDAATVLNVGAGAGSYEPAGREVTAVEPSAEMIAQRPASAAPVVQASAEDLPFEDDSFDAAMGVLTVHHWPDLDAGLAELQRVARRRTVLVTFNPEPLADLWIVREYFPGMLPAQPGRTSDRQLVAKLPTARSLPLPVPSDCEDLFFAALWARPELFLEPHVVGPMWVWSQLSGEEKQQGLDRLAADLASGAWDERHGHLRHQPELDVGLRIIVAELGIAVREATEADAGAVAALWTEAYVVEGGGRALPYSEADFLETARDGTILVAERQGAVVGVVALLRPATSGRAVARPEEAELARLAVSTTARRLGIGATLVGRCEELARDAGWDAIALWSRSYQTEAHRLYESRGYRRTPERDSVDASGHERLVFRLAP